MTGEVRELHERSRELDRRSPARIRRPGCRRMDGFRSARACHEQERACCPHHEPGSPHATLGYVGLLAPSRSGSLPGAARARSVQQGPGDLGITGADDHLVGLRGRGTDPRLDVIPAEEANLVLGAPPVPARDPLPSAPSAAEDEIGDVFAGELRNHDREEIGHDVEHPRSIGPDGLRFCERCPAVLRPRPVTFVRPTGRSAGRSPPRGTTHMCAISCSTRSSTERKGSLHSTVRWAWSFSFRCTQSTV
jgi:hypothetical protein